MKNLTLYHYVHCPFCIRVRLALKILNIQYKSVVLPYDDEITPVELAGAKMLPILTVGDFAMSESLDIIQFMDKKDTLNWELLGEEKVIVDNILSEVAKNLHPLAMPYWIYTPEFDNASRKYFQTKKERKRGPFNELVKNREIYIEGLNNILEEVSGNLTPFFKSSKISIIDILLYSHIVGNYVVVGYQVPKKIDAYMKKVEKDNSFSYHGIFWQGNEPFYQLIRKSNK